jgi:hypothetical protein
MIAPSAIGADIFVAVGGTGSGVNWSFPKGDLEAVAFGALQNDRILVKQGAFGFAGGASQTGTDVRTRTLRLKPAVRAYGSFPTGATTDNLAQRNVHSTPTTVSGAFLIGTTTHHAFHVCSIIPSKEAASNQIDGFILRDGRAVGNPMGVPQDPPQSNVGGGVVLLEPEWKGLDVPVVSVIQNCIIRNNIAQLGGGVGCNNFAQARPRPTIRATFVVDNEAVGSIGEDPIGDPSASVAGGGLYFHVSSAELVSSVVAGNETDGNGGGLAIARAGVIDLVNSTVTENVADGFGGGVSAPAIFGSAATLRSTIVYFNSSSDTTVFRKQISNNGGPLSAEAADYSCIQGTIPASLGVGNIDSNPMLASTNPGAGNLRSIPLGYALACGSPCVHGGDPNTNLVPDDLYDVDNDNDLTEETPTMIRATRVRACRVDIGADESALFISCPGDADGDGTVGPADLALVLGAWGTSNPLYDFNCDGIVNGADSSVVLGGWGPCCPSSGGGSSMMGEGGEGSEGSAESPIDPWSLALWLGFSDLAEFQMWLSEQSFETAAEALAPLMGGA